MLRAHLAADVRLNVYVTCDGSDIVGAHLCFAVKEGIIRSVGLQLVDDRTARTGIAVHLVSVDASPSGLPIGPPAGRPQRLNEGSSDEQ